MNASSPVLFRPKNIRRMPSRLSSQDSLTMRKEKRKNMYCGRSMENFFSVLQTPSKSYERKTLLMYEHEVRLCVVSNWGNPNYVSCSVIEIMDREHHMITPASVLLNGISKRDPRLEGLFVRQVGRKNMKDSWKYEFDEKFNPLPLEIVINLKSDNDLLTLRIWPNDMMKDANIQNLNVFVDDCLVYSGILNEELPVNIPLNVKPKKSVENYMIAPLHKGSRPMKIGNWPLAPTRTVDFKILQGYSNYKEFSFEKIVFFDLYGPYRITNNIKVQTTGISLDKPLISFLGEDPEPFKGEFEPDNKISLHFPEGVIITAIQFVNPVFEGNYDDYGVKKIKVDINGINRWIGKIDSKLVWPGTGQYVLFLTDEPNIQEMVKDQTEARIMINEEDEYTINHFF